MEFGSSMGNEEQEYRGEYTVIMCMWQSCICPVFTADNQRDLGGSVFKV